ncbi:MAG: biotin transporter BioY [Propionibacteriaceae bacterium]|jgi:biotin transport system substrate-specific component|nr:biotin transporter BioY [Propionibacteriaceae bacterium]
MKERNGAFDLALIAVFAALTAVCSLIPGIQLPVGVPITLQTLAVLLAGLVLGPWRGFLAVLLYLAVGFAGLPVFADATGGLVVFEMPSIGYLLSFPFAALAAGALAKLFVKLAWKGQAGWLIGSAIVTSLIVVDIPGIIGMMVVLRVDFWAAFGYNLPFVPGDLAKCVIAGLIAVVVHKAFPVLLAAKAPVTA